MKHHKPTQLMRDVAKLELPGPSAGAACASEASMRPDDRTHAIAELRAAGLDDAAVAALLVKLDDARVAHGIVSGWPTIGTDRKVLTAAAELARALGAVLQGSSPRATAEIATAAWKALGRADTTTAMPDELLRFAAELQGRIARMPNQTRNKSRIDLVRALDEAAGHLLPAPTKHPDSPYHRACCAAFALAGCPFGPDKGIEAFLKKRAGRQPAKSEGQ